MKEVKHIDMMTFATVFHNENYIGSVSVSDNYVHVFMNDPHDEVSMRVDEL